MRKNKRESAHLSYRILTVDDDPIMTETLQSFFSRAGYTVDTENDPVAAIEDIRNGSYDILLLDFLMNPICGDKVVEEIRKFNRSLFIILLTGHKNMAPPIQTIRNLDIQGYYEKNDRFDQLELLVESCVKTIKQVRINRGYQNGLKTMNSFIPDMYQNQSIEDLTMKIVNGFDKIIETEECLVKVSVHSPDGEDTVINADNGKTLEEGERFSIEGEFVGNDNNRYGTITATFDEEPDVFKHQLFEIYVRQCSAVLENAFVMKKLNESYFDMVAAMRIMEDARDTYTRGHSDRVAEYAVLLAENLGCDREQCEKIKTAGLFHDVGKVAVPDSVLLSPNKLTDDEYSVMKRHSSKGAEILSSIGTFDDLIPIVRAHHEKYNGTGYPDGLAGNEIPFEARIIAIADAFDAMTSNRCYRTGMPIEKALSIINAEKGIQFDEKMAEVFIKCIPGKFDEIRAEIP